MHRILTALALSCSRSAAAWAQGVPSAMIFIRNDDGSHNAKEKMAIEDFAVASQVLWGMLDELAA